MQKYEPPAEKAMHSHTSHIPHMSPMSMCKNKSVMKQFCPKCGSPMESRMIWTCPAGIEISMCTVCRFYKKIIPDLKG